MCRRYMLERAFAWAQSPLLPVCQRPVPILVAGTVRTYTRRFPYINGKISLRLTHVYVPRAAAIIAV